MIGIKTYNKYVKISGKTITIKDYIDMENMIGYTVKKNNSTNDESKELYKSLNKEMEGNFTERELCTNASIKLFKILDKLIEGELTERESYEKHCLRATQNLFDTVECNIDKWQAYNPKTEKYNGGKCTTKFLTLTFKEEIEDIKKANYEFTKFNKRLSWDLYKINKNVMKYICVPEIQEKRYKEYQCEVWHYHVIYFNLPFKKWDKLLEIWKDKTKGGLFVESIENDKDGKPIESVTKYVAKYVSKCNSQGLQNYDLWSKRGLQNKKRFMTSKGLYKPIERRYLIEDEEMAGVYEESVNSSYDAKTYETKYRGKIVLTKYKMEQLQSKRLLRDLESMNKCNLLKNNYQTKENLISKLFNELDIKKELEEIEIDKKFEKYPMAIARDLIKKIETDGQLRMTI